MTLLTGEPLEDWLQALWKAGWWAPLTGLPLEGWLVWYALCICAKLADGIADWWASGIQNGGPSGRLACGRADWRASGGLAGRRSGRLAGGPNDW